MPKKRVIFLVLILAASGVLAFLAFILLKPEADASAAAEIPPVEYILQLEGIKSVTVKNAEGEFTVFPGKPEAEQSADAAPDSAGPFIAGFEDSAMSDWDLGRMLEIPAGLISRGLVDEAPAELAPFGLDPPRAEVRVETESGRAVLYLGNDAPDGSSVYTAKEGDSAVYLAESWSLGNFFKRALDFADLSVTPAPVDDGAGSFVCDSIRLGGAVRRGEEITVLKESRTGDASEGIMEGPFRLTSPLEARFSLDKGAPILQGIFGIRASRAVAKDPDLAAYGLADPWSTVSVSGTLEKGLGGFAVRASRPDSAGNVYLMKEGSNLVFEAAASALPWLSVSWFDLMEKLITLPFIDSVAAVEVRMPERTVEFTLSGEEDELKVRAGGIDVDTSVFRSYYQTLLTASYEDRTDISPASLPAPFLEIVYRYRGEKDPERIRFYSTGSRRVLVNYNGGSVFSTYSAYTDKVIADLDQVLAGQKVLPYL
ncbi:MAG: DUF4340 domain-containing protein [Treponema sp.]|nr:DUF4340 domain-containing protein [Treponema sp.]